MQQWALLTLKEGLQTRARNPSKVAVAVTCLRPYLMRFQGGCWLLWLWLCRGAEEGSADDVVGRAGAPGSRFQAQGSP